MSSDVYDAQAALERAGGDPHRARQFLAMLLDLLTQVEQALPIAIARNDYNTLKEHAHRLAGAATYCGASALHDAAKQLESLACEEDHELNSALAQVLMNEIAQFRRVIRGQDH
jgi:HPt (histidine-containing phosphotransfer) domain-containing protein